jgi:hypothetical protein
VHSILEETVVAPLVQGLDMRTNRNAGLHFTPEGYKLMYEAVTKVTKEELPELCPENLPFVFPPWAQALKPSL